MEILGIEVDIYVAIVMIAIGLILAIIWLCIGILSKASQNAIVARKKRKTKKRSSTSSRKQIQTTGIEDTQGQMPSYNPEFQNQADMVLQGAAANAAPENQSAASSAPEKKSTLNQAPPVQVQMDAAIQNAEGDAPAEPKAPGDTASLLWQPEEEEEEESKETDSIFEIFQEAESEESSDIATIAANVTDVEINDLLNLHREMAAFSQQNTED